MSSPAFNPTTDKRARLLGLVVAGACAVTFGLQLRLEPPSWNEASRLAVVESLVERGTWRIDDSEFVVTGDKLMFGSHYYSDKPPMFQALAAVPYSFFHRVLGMELTLQACGSDWACGRRWLTTTMVALPAAALLGLFCFNAMRWMATTAALGATVLLGFGTMLWPYALVFMPHAPTAAFLYACLYLLGRDRSTTRSPGRRLLVAGMLAGLAASFELPTLFLAAGLGALAFFRYRRYALCFVLGAALPTALSLLFNYRISGSVLPAVLLSEGFQYEGSRFPAPGGRLAPLSSIPGYAFRGLLGERGLLSHCPLLLWCLAGLIRVARARHHPLHWDAITVLIGASVFSVFLLSREGLEHGGKAYGQRYFLALVPLLASFGPFGVPRALRSLRQWLSAVALVAAAGLSLASAREGAARIWTPGGPWVYLELGDSTPYLTVCSGLREDPCFDWKRWRRRWLRNRDPRRHPPGAI